MESAMSSRLIREVFMPSVPMVMPSEMETVLNSSGVPPAARYARLDVLGERAEVVIAGPDLGPGVRDPDQRLGEIFVGKPDRFHHGAGRGAARAVGDKVAVAFTGNHGGKSQLTLPKHLRQGE